jgi:hypothetical protein
MILISTPCTIWTMSIIITPWTMMIGLTIPFVALIIGVSGWRGHTSIRRFVVITRRSVPVLLRTWLGIGVLRVRMSRMSRSHERRSILGWRSNRRLNLISAILLIWVRLHHWMRLRMGVGSIVLDWKVMISWLVRLMLLTRVSIVILRSVGWSTRTIESGTGRRTTNKTSVWFLLDLVHLWRSLMITASTDSELLSSSSSFSFTRLVTWRR